MLKRPNPLALRGTNSTKERENSGTLGGIYHDETHDETYEEYNGYHVYSPA